MEFTIELAGKVIDIYSQYPTLKTFCKDYLVEGREADFEVVLSMEDIEAEQDHMAEEAYKMEYLETLAVLRKIADGLPFYDRLLVHGAAITYEGSGYLFMAPSGTGKSTHIALWRKYLGGEVGIINGDKPVLSVETSGICVHGTPWGGKEGWQKNRSAQLKAICFLKRGKDNRIRRLTPEEAFPFLMRQVYIPPEKEAVCLTLELLNQILDRVPMHLLECDISEEAVRCSLVGMYNSKKRK